MHEKYRTNTKVVTGNILTKLVLHRYFFKNRLFTLCIRVMIPKIRGYLLEISTNFSRLSTDQSEKQEADLALTNLTDRKMDLVSACT